MHGITNRKTHGGTHGKCIRNVGGTHLETEGVRTQLRMEKRYGTTKSETAAREKGTNSNTF